MKQPTKETNDNLHTFLRCFPQKWSVGVIMGIQAVLLLASAWVEPGTWWTLWNATRGVVSLLVVIGLLRHSSSLLRLPLLVFPISLFVNMIGLGMEVMDWYQSPLAERWPWWCKDGKSILDSSTCSMKAAGGAVGFVIGGVVGWILKTGWSVLLAQHCFALAKREERKKE